MENGSYHNVIIVMTQKSSIAILSCLFSPSLLLHAELLAAAAESLGRKKEKARVRTHMHARTPQSSALFMLTAAFDLENDVPPGPVVSILLLD